MNFFNEFNPSEFDKLFDNKYCFFKDRKILLCCFNICKFIRYFVEAQNETTPLQIYRKNLAQKTKGNNIMVV